MGKALKTIFIGAAGGAFIIGTGGFGAGIGAGILSSASLLGGSAIGSALGVGITATVAGAIGGAIIAGATLALGSLSKMLAPKNKLDSGQELRSSIRSATPPRLTAYGEVSLPSVRAFTPGYGMKP